MWRLLLVLLATPNPGTGSANGETIYGPLTVNGDIIGGHEKDLVDATPTDFVRIGVVQGGHAHGQIIWSVFATDGTDMQSLQGAFTFAAVNKAGTITCDVEEGFSLPSGDAYASAVSAGTITMDAVACVEDAADTIDISIDVDTSLASTTKFEIEYRLNTIEDYGIVPL